MSVREIRGHLEEFYGIDVSADLISAVTDAVLEEVAEWQNRPLDVCYPLVFFDAIRVKIRDEGFVRNKAVYIALGIRPDGTKEILGIWIEQTEGAKFWLRVMNELKNRGIGDILIAVVDGLKGFPEAINAVFPLTVIQTCIVHLIRHSLEFVSWKDRKLVVPALKAIYRAKNAEAGLKALAEFETSFWGQRYPAIAQSWQRNWEHVVPFFAYPESVRRIIYTTNAIEALNAKLRRAVRARGHFPNDDAAMKLLYLVLNNAADEWKRPPREWFEAKTQFAVVFGEGLVDHTLGGGVHPRIGNRIEPMRQLGVQVVEVAERAGEEEVLADVPIRPLDLAFGFGPVRSASLWLEAIVPGEVNERAVVDDAAAGFADDRGLHAVVEDLAGDAADRREGRDVTTKNRLHVLVQDKARPNQPAEAEHEREQPDDARDRWLIFELQLELGKVDLRLIARWRLEADLKGRQWGRTNLAQHVSDGGIAAFVSALTKLPQKPAAGQAGIGHHTLAQIGDKRINPSLARLAWTIDRRFQATCDAFANGLAIETELTGDRRDRQSPCR